MRKMITGVIEQHKQLYVIGIARNGEDAIEKANRLKPDIIVMDHEMPVMNGLTALQQIMESNPIPVIMLTQQVIEQTHVLALGAYSAFTKKNIINGVNKVELDIFYNCLLEAAKTVVPIIVSKIEQQEPEITFAESEFELVLIGSSTGGPNALQQILIHVERDFPTPILIVQHMPVGFTKSLAQRFHQLCKVPVAEVEHGEILKKGHIYIAPAGIHVMIEKNSDGQLFANLDHSTDVETLYKPAIDVALKSIPKAVQPNVLTVILTGMGDDGLNGCRDIKKNGGYIIGEHPDSCVIYGMPKVVFEAGLCNDQILIQQMYLKIVQVVERNIKDTL